MQDFSQSIDSARSIADVRVALRDALTSKYGEREGAEMARRVIMHLKGWDLSHLLANESREASDFIKGRSAEILNDLLHDKPLQYALGETTFYGLNLKVMPGVLIPRPETEELVDLIVKENHGSDLRVLDLCTGSGAIAVALARNLPFSKVVAVDISPQAVELATENTQNLKTGVRILKADVLDPLFVENLPQGPYDIIVANPPYVDESEKNGMEANVLDYEPHLALFVPDDNPLLFYRKIASDAMRLLAPGGRLYFEINPRHADELRRMLEERGYSEVEILKDVHGNPRFAKCIRP